MPTLKEFITDVLHHENIPGDVDEIAKQIEDIARKRAVNNVAAICDEEVREMVINKAELSLKLNEEKAKKEEKRKAEKVLADAKKKEEKIKKQLEKERKVFIGEQQALF